ncbi:MAG: WecB/TagA/CpsF family glycosyltransferase [Bacteroidales bacterium]|jgi:UDP-N-acetyl-D-mannosaminouronate:lipid I N-acetyl-D-mannosaminouronosyltransferase|nr:WecB/TagA/CpsF family glycosyltransferase [Bacteroidales bacterium]
MNSVNLNNVKTHAFSSRDELIQNAFQEKKILIAINAEKILHATEQTRTIISNNIGYADGIGAVWALHKKGFKDAIKIPGCELWLDIVRAAYKDKTFYLIGSRQEVIETTVSKLKKEFEGINILNYCNGFIANDEEKEILLADIELNKPDIVFVAMGSPKQEFLMHEMQQRHRAIYQGLGGSFDVYTGHVERAPAWWVKHNLEWAYRMVKQPSRIKRQIHLLRFFVLLKLNRL